MEDEDEYSDDEDTSWKVRRSAAKLCNSICSECSLSDDILKEVLTALISRIPEREETVRISVAEALTAVIRTHLQGGKQRFVSSSAACFQFIAESRRQQIVIAFAAKIVSQVCKGNGNSLRIREAMIKLLSALLDGVASEFTFTEASFSQICRYAAASFKIGENDIALRMETLNLFQQLLGRARCNVNTTQLEDHIPICADVLRKAVADPYFKVAMEACRCLSLLVRSVRPLHPPSTQKNWRNEDEQHVHIWEGDDVHPQAEEVLRSLFDCLACKIAANDVYLKVKVEAIKAISTVLAHAGDILQETPTGLAILASAMNDEPTRCPAALALTHLLPSPVDCEAEVKRGMAPASVFIPMEMPLLHEITRTAMGMMSQKDYAARITGSRCLAGVLFR